MSDQEDDDISYFGYLITAGAIIKSEGREDLGSHICKAGIKIDELQSEITRLRAENEKLREERASIIERCAKVCEARYMGDNNREDMEAKRCAAAIREIGGSRE